MTTVAAVQGPSWVVIGYDSQVSETDGRTYQLPSGAGKCVEVGPFVIGVAGDFRVVNLLAHSFTPPDPEKSQGSKLDKYMTTRFIPSLKKCFDLNFYGKDGEHGSELIVAVNGVAYEIGSNYDCIRDEHGLYSIGSGGTFALGALYALDEGKRRGIRKAKDHIEAALNISVLLDSGTSDPITIITQHAIS
jgi:ATP-dependent protease HslVU (ClpYQ) peptidase subunit